jgi:hypothetical protein
MVTRDLAREAPAGFFGLAGLPAPSSPIRNEDISVIIPELQADKVMVVDDPHPYALYPEFQKKPADDETMQNWALKQLVLTRHLKMPVCLVVYYLHRGDRATFPESFFMGLPSLPSQVLFPTIQVWKKEDEIRQKYPELAALLLVTAQEPTEETLREVKQLLDRVENPSQKRDNMYGLAAMLGMHFLKEALVRAVFGPKFEEIKKMGVIDRWLDEKYKEGLDQGISQGISQGIDQGARRIVLGLLADKFGQVPASVAERVQHADAAWCQNLNLLIARARTLDDLNLS